ncbi:SGNH/GDSL hydrolase family protein [Eubacterium ruminantium]|uniref:SGNH/GDSL hydrolase family protein n=1 Tax=Eubacterium ruminantium TaxID=42322 RepID=UPI002478ADC7|nr:SGNH/GDSL hydrolase family protein [Eubacterium ruminantium]
MKLTNEELKKIYRGALYFEETVDGYLKANQYTKPQMDYFEKAFLMWFERCDASSAKTIEFKTDATKVSFDYKIIWKSSEDSIELAIDGLATQIAYLKDIDMEGTISWDMPKGQKNVTIYLPCDATILIRNFEIDSSYETVQKNEKVLWLGDSITQGYGPLRSYQTYVSVANRILNYDILNQGIGGYIYDKNSLVKMDGYNPDKIIVALGTNQYGDENGTQVVSEYYETLIGIYGEDIPILVITPLWRGDNLEGVPTLEKFCAAIREIVGKYKNIKVVDGFKMVPHLGEYFIDNLHPNGLGTEVYGRNLVEEIRRIGF